jgi:hypothetical protein
MVPSTLKTLIDFFNQHCLSFRFQAKFWSMNFPPAPESIRAFVSMILLDFLGSTENETSIEIDLFSIVPISTE